MYDVFLAHFLSLGWFGAEISAEICMGVVEAEIMTQEHWAAHIPALKRAASQANTRRKRFKMWFDNEGFL